MGLDIVAHWLHLHTTQELGKSSHKSFGPDSNPILRIYYTNRTVLFLMCAGNEIFYRFLNKNKIVIVLRQFTQFEVNITDKE